MSQMSIPVSEPGDSDDVTLALETAEALWNKGDPNEALRWLRRAAEAAGHSGDDMRAVELAKAVADLNAATPEPSAPRQVRPPPLPPEAPTTRTDALPDPDVVTSVSSLGAPKGVSKAPPPPPSARKGMPAKSAEESASELEASPEEGAAQATSAPAKLLNPPPPPGGNRLKRERVSEIVDQEETAASRSQAPLSTRTPLNKSARPVSKAPKAPASAGKMPATKSQAGKPRHFARAALKVYVLPGEQEEEQLDVRVLKAGERPPPGAVEALLVPLRRGAKFLK